MEYDDGDDRRSISQVANVLPHNPCNAPGDDDDDW